MIDEIISATHLATDAINGSSLNSETAALQFEPEASGDFSIRLEAAARVAKGNDPIFTAIGDYTQDDATRHSVIPITGGTRYRLTHQSGVAVRVIFSG